MSPSKNPALMNAFAAVLKARRSALGISQEELARRSGVNRSFVARIEIAQNQPTLSVLFRLSHGLNVAPEELIRQARLKLEGQT